MLSFPIQRSRRPPFARIHTKVLFTSMPLFAQVWERFTNQSVFNLFCMHPPPECLQYDLCTPAKSWEISLIPKASLSLSPSPFPLPRRDHRRHPQSKRLHLLTPAQSRDFRLTAPSPCPLPSSTTARAIPPGSAARGSPRAPPQHSAPCLCRLCLAAPSSPSRSQATALSPRQVRLFFNFSFFHE